ncbi:CHAT domain-containing protein/Tfp pilus assembly protein PilF [Catalinimonas alkaloidigena]|uniref:CHAT domain-containing protein n=1 Tax=Catalinimonas alkaloidigena TaxID=1075417 RepID=UPI0024059F82|nr:CHAT domain-containing protein [Catalinimonas alkaloidigena]MDF9796168.1 CHAT domain-containing protein/Tfp pilus assembly protein PilF [Catalinimonas alkaloidigena]
MYLSRLLTFFILLLCLCTFKIHAQKLRTEEAHRLFHTADSLFHLPDATPDTDSLSILNFQQAIQSFGEDSLQLQVEAHQKIGNLYEMNLLFDSALYHYKSSLRKAQLLAPPADTLKFYANLYCGDAFQYLEMFDSAQYFYSQAEVNIPPNIKEAESARLYNSSGLLQFHVGNYQQAINYLEKGASLLRNNPYAEFIIKNNLAIAYDKLRKYNTSIPIYKSLLSNKNIPEAIYQNIGKAYGELGKYDSAKLYLLKATFSQNIDTKLAALNNLGNVYFQKNQTDSARYLYQRSIETNQAYSNQSRINLGGAFIGLATIELHNREAEESLILYQRALNTIAFNFDNQDYYTNPENLFSGLSLLTLFNIYEGKGNAFKSLYAQNASLTALEASLQNYDNAIQVARYIQKTYDNDEAKLFLVQNVYPVYEIAISTAYQLYRLTKDQKYVDLAFQFSENSKAAILSEILDDLDIKSTLPNIDSLIQAEKRQKQQISQLRLRLIESQDSSENSSLKTKLNDLEINLSRTLRSLQSDEKYFRLKYQEDTIHASDIQRTLLDQDDALLEYFLGKDSLYCFLLTRDNFLLKVQHVDSAFFQAIQLVQSELYQYQMGQAYKESEQAYILYQKLIEPFEKEISGKEKLIIVPDGQLNYIPFEMLNDAPISNHYLIYDYAFSYAYSASLLEDAVRTRKAKESNGILAMAPFAGDEEGNIRSNGFSLLFGSKEEVENIGGSIYLENQATKRLFLELVSSYGIIHLATHASIDNNDPLQSFIAFYPDEDESLAGYRLYTQELYNLQLDSVKLVVLSACEAGNGQLVKGEGIISLARAFAYAGCPNIVTTLWKAQDKSTATIAANLHDYLKRGFPKDKALRQAKLDYLNADDIHPLLKTPYYWANFVFIGDTAPIYESSGTWLWWLMLGLILLGGVYWLVKKTFLKLK